MDLTNVMQSWVNRFNKTCQIARWADFKQATCSICFDDGTLDQYLLAHPLLKGKNINVTFFIISAFMDTGYWLDNDNQRKLFSWFQARELAAAGHEIGSHSATHINFIKNINKIKQECLNSKNKIDHNIQTQKCISYCWPYWSTNRELQDLIADYYLVAVDGMTSIEQYLSQKSHIFYDYNKNFYQVKSLAVLDSFTQDSWQSLIDYKYDKRDWFIITLHGIDDGRIEREALGYKPVSLDNFTWLLYYLMSKDFWLAPLGTVIKYIGVRDHTVIGIKYTSPQKIILNLKQDFDHEYLNQLLTIKIPLPTGWKDVNIIQQNEQKNTVIKEGFISFNITPSQGDILIHKIH